MKKADLKQHLDAVRSWIDQIIEETDCETPVDVARVSGVSPSTVTRPYYNKDWPNRFSARTIEMIAQATGVLPPDILAPRSTGDVRNLLGKSLNSSGAGLTLPKDNEMEPLEEMAVEVLEQSTIDRAVFLFRTALERKKAGEKRRKKPPNP